MATESQRRKFKVESLEYGAERLQFRDMRYIKLIGVLAIVCMMFSSCSLFRRKHHAGSAVEVNGHYLEYTDLDQLTLGLSPEDSAIVADNYIKQWSTEVLLYDKARNKVDDKHIEALVEDYRRSLYAHAYAEHLVQHMSKRIPQAEIDSFYALHKNQYILKDALVKGLLLIVPNGAPDLEKVKKALAKTDEKNIEFIEKYAYRYATGYELFTDEWKTLSQLSVWMPMKKADMQKQLKPNTLVTMTDSVSTYMLQVNDVHAAGTVMPIEYARSEIEPVLLRERATEYLQRERERIYEDGVRFKKIHRYEKK